MPGSQDLSELVAELSRPRWLGNALGRVTGSGRAGRLVARLLRALTGPRRATIAMTTLHARLLRATRGRMRRSWLFAAGQPVMALTTTGRRSGARRTTPVTALVVDGKLGTVGMNLGREEHPAWVHNLLADPDAWIEVRGMRVAVRARLATGEERQRLWEHWLHVQPSAQRFQELSRRDIPVFVLEARPDGGTANRS